MAAPALQLWKEKDARPDVLVMDAVTLVSTLQLSTPHTHLACNHYHTEVYDVP
jgi:hypothetical protein